MKCPHCGANGCHLTSYASTTIAAGTAASTMLGGLAGLTMLFPPAGGAALIAAYMLTGAGTAASAAKGVIVGKAIGKAVDHVLGIYECYGCHKTFMR